MLAYSLRKHAGVRSYVLPMDLYDSETWGNMDVDWNMQHQVRGEHLDHPTTAVVVVAFLRCKRIGTKA